MKQINHSALPNGFRHVSLVLSPRPMPAPSMPSAPVSAAGILPARALHDDTDKEIIRL